MKQFYRLFIYVCGLFALALGIVLNTKANLGVSPIICVPYGISVIWNINLGFATAAIYILYVFGQIAILGKAFSPVQLLQIPLSIAFGVVINFFSQFIQINSQNLLLNLLLLTCGILFTGIGAAFTLLMNLLPNAADGLVQAISKKSGKALGFAKNMLDAASVILSIVIGFTFAGKTVGIGLGTILAVVGVGRAIALTNTLFQKKLLVLVHD